MANSGSGEFSRRSVLLRVPATTAVPVPKVWASIPLRPLAFWNDKPAKWAVPDFVRTITDRSSRDFASPPDRIATLDQNGTLWAEAPIYTNVAFALTRLRELAPSHLESQSAEPLESVFSDDDAAFAKLNDAYEIAVIGVTQSRMTTEAFHGSVVAWLKAARHPRYRLPYADLVYQPMLEVMTFPRANGYKTYIVPGTEQDFMRVYSQRLSGAPREHVVGSIARRSTSSKPASRCGCGSCKNPPSTITTARRSGSAVSPAKAHTQHSEFNRRPPDARMNRGGQRGALTDVGLSL